MQMHEDPVITLFNSDMTSSSFLSDLALSNNYLIIVL